VGHSPKASRRFSVDKKLQIRSWVWLGVSLLGHPNGNCQVFVLVLGMMDMKAFQLAVSAQDTAERFLARLLWELKAGFLTVFGKPREKQYNESHIQESL